MEQAVGVTMREILSPQCSPERRYLNFTDAVALVAQLKSAGYEVGVVGGVWDLIHLGHARYLRLAKAECQILVVVVDSDQLVKHRKGPSRPVVPESERIQMVCHLVSADIVIVRDLDEHTKDKEYINKALHPDVCILSTSTGDISAEQRDVIAQHVGRIKVFLPQAETSSSARIRLLAIDGATPLAKSVTKLVEEKVVQVAQLLSGLPQELHVLAETHIEGLNKS
jgi:D-beta-D-heptose 7-phosphate kinase/D-beta-D-heptose 1-phosphate adenosyltransferase